LKLSRKGLIAAVGALTVLVVLTIILFLVLRKTPPLALLNILPKEIDVEVKDVIYREVGTTGVKWEVKADQARYLKNENLAVFEKVRIRFTLSDGRVVVLEGDRGRLRTDSQDIDISGNVTVSSFEGDRFRTNSVQFSKKTEIASTRDPVVLESGNVHIEAVGMVLSLKEETLTLTSRVKAKVY